MDDTDRHEVAAMELIAYLRQLPGDVQTFALIMILKEQWLDTYLRDIAYRSNLPDWVRAVTEADDIESAIDIAIDLLLDAARQYAKGGRP